MFSIAPHGKTIVAALPYTAQIGGHIGLQAKDLRGHLSVLRALLKRFGPADGESEHPFVIEAAEDGATHLFYRFPPNVLDGGKECRIYLSLPEAANLATELTVIEVKTRTRTRVRPQAGSAPGAQVRKRTRGRAG